MVQLDIAEGEKFSVVFNKEEEKISVFREGIEEPVVVQKTRKNFRPYLHPVKAPDGEGVLTQYSPGHHTHQTGIYWGFTRVNGRDYFHNPGGDYWQRQSARVVKAAGDTVRWGTVYNLLDQEGNAILTETQHWAMTQREGKFVLDLEWTGEAKKDITVGEYDYGGLFLRMPWHEGVEGEVTNAAGQQNQEAEGQRSIWVDVGMEIEGREDYGHVAIFDHPDNAGAPLPWRVDGQMGVGPARARMGDWHIKRGETETIQHEIVVYTGQRNDIELTNMWEQYTGQSAQYAQTVLWEQAQQEGRQAEFLAPELAAKNMTLPEGFEVNAWAGDSLVTQPMAFAWDDKGRLWVAENRDYESRQTGFSGSGGESRIIILEDTDRDGEADKRKIFIEGIPFPSALEVGFGGVFVGAPPHLLFIPDRDGDDKADPDDIEIRLTGWGIRDRHEVINSFHWGPDGWLYGLEGFATSSKIHKPAEDARLYEPGEPFPEDILEGKGTEMNGGVWRYHPVKDRFEVVAHGFSNPWGIDYNAKGEMFITACVIPHMFEVIQGGYYQRQGGQHFNPYVYSDIETIVDHRHRSAHGGARIYQSDAFPKKHQGRLFMANIHEHAVLSDKLTRKGSGYVASHGEDFMKANNAQFVGFSMEVGPGGNLYTLDWHDGDICGKEVLDANTGRIFRVTPTESNAENWDGRYADLGAMSDIQLAELQERNSNWHARRARVILQHRATQQSISKQAQAKLWDLYQNHPNIDYRLRGMWGLHVAGLLAEKDLAKALQDRNEFIRGWAITLLTEDKDPSEAALNRFTRMARSDQSPFVRKQLASALQRMDDEARWNIIEELIQHPEDADDHNIPKMIWFGLEPLVGQQPQKAMQLAPHSEIPLVTNHMARRTVDAEALQTLVASIGENSSNPQVQLHLLEGMQDGLEGQNEHTAPPNWDSVYQQLRQDDNERVRAIARRLAQRFGDVGATQQSFALVTDGSAQLENRRRALQTLADQQYPKLVEQIPTLLEEPGLRSTAIRAIAEYDREPLGNLLIERYDAFSEADKTAAIQTLASRPTYGWILTQALKKGTIPKNDVPPYIARQLKRVVGSGFMEVWGQPIAQDEEQVETKTAQYKQLLTEKALGNADISDGKLVFENTCAPCHKMFGEGGEVGPDLTGSNRTSVDYILFHVLRPDAVVQDAYKMVVVNMRDGRTYTGTLVGKNEQQITMQLVSREPVVLNKSEIESRENTDVSMMPPHLLDNLDEEEVINLVSYLRDAGQEDGE